MKLKPFQLTQEEPSNEDSAISEALKLAGITTLQSDDTTKNAELVNVRNILTQQGAGIVDAAAALASALGEEKTKLNAAKLAFQVHGVLKDEKASNIPSVSITINAGTMKEKTLFDILVPREVAVADNPAQEKL